MDRFATYREISPRRGSLARRLRSIVGRERVLTSALEVSAYDYDASMEAGHPIAVVFPESVRDVAAIIRVCRDAGVPLIPRGSGTNLSGGSTAPHGGVICQLSRMNRIIDILPDERRVVAQPFVYNNAVNEAVAPFGLHFAPDPSSYKVSTLGGNAAENSGGPHALKYGVTAHHVLGVEIVTADGEIVRYGGKALERAGPDMLSLVIGSEGTLGVITEVTLRLTPLPEHVVTLLAIFDAEADAGRAVSAVIASGIIPSTLELMDRRTMEAVEKSVHAGYPADADAVLLIELDGVREAVADEARVAERACRELGARSVEATSEPAQRERLWVGRRVAYAALARAATGMMVCDGVVPRDVLPEALRRIRAIVAEHGIAMADTFHAGDGNVHPKLLFDASDPGQLRSAMDASDEIMRTCIDLGGAITGEHGVGTEKIHAVPWSLDGATLRLNRAVKLAFDGAERFNPGKVLRAEDVPAAPVARPSEGDVWQALQGAADGAARPGGDEDELDGLRPRWVCSPHTPESLAEVLRACAEHEASVGVVGGRTALHWGPPREVLDVLISTTNLVGVLELRPQNLTATFAAGTPLSVARGIVAAEGLALRIDAPQGDRATIGGIVATATSGPTRLAYGSARESVLGIGAALTTGELAQFGGRVMKNVAGYDLTHLLIGARDALAAIAHVTLRLIPAPRQTREMAAEVPSIDEAMELGLRVLRSVREVTAVVACGPSEGPAKIAVYLAGHELAVERLSCECAAVLRGSGGFNCARAVLHGPAAHSWPYTSPPSPFGADLTGVDRALRPSPPAPLPGERGARAERGRGEGTSTISQDDPAWPVPAPMPPSPEHACVEVSVPGSRELDALLAARALLPVRRVTAHLGTGSLTLQLGTTTPAEIRALDRRLAELGGWVRDLAGPPEMRRDYFSSAPPDVRLGRIRAAFDPAGVLSRRAAPRRFPPGDGERQ